MGNSVQTRKPNGQLSTVNADTTAIFDEMQTDPLYEEAQVVVDMTQKMVVAAFAEANERNRSRLMAANRRISSLRSRAIKQNAEYMQQAFLDVRKDLADVYKVLGVQDDSSCSAIKAFREVIKDILATTGASEVEVNEKFEQIKAEARELAGAK